MISITTLIVSYLNCFVFYLEKKKKITFTSITCPHPGCFPNIEWYFFKARKENADNCNSRDPANKEVHKLLCAGRYLLTSPRAVGNTCDLSTACLMADFGRDFPASFLFLSVLNMAGLKQDANNFSWTMCCFLAKTYDSANIFCSESGWNLAMVYTSWLDNHNPCKVSSESNLQPRIRFDVHLSTQPSYPTSYWKHVKIDQTHGKRIQK